RLGERPAGPGRVRVLEVRVEDRAPGRGRLRVGMVGAGEVELEPLADRALQLGSYQRRLGLDVQAGEHEGHRVAVPAEPDGTDLDGGRWRVPPHSGDRHAIGAGVVQLDGVEPRDDVRAQVPGRPDLVQQL